MRTKDNLGKFVAVDPVERLKNSYIVDPITGCWKYNKKLHPDGYGYLKINGKMIKAHRFSYETFVGPLVKGLQICHRCNCKSCINPEHLRQDTHSSNQIDRVYDGNNSYQKLTPDQVKEIKIELRNYYKGMNKILSEKYNVHRATISDIKLGKRWSHLKI